MPSDHGVRLDDDEGGTPADPEPGQPDPEDAVAAAEPWTAGPSLKDGNLLPEGEVLRYEASPCGPKEPDQVPGDTPSPHWGLLPEGRSGVF